MWYLDLLIEWIAYLSIFLEKPQIRIFQLNNMTLLWHMTET